MRPVARIASLIAFAVAATIIVAACSQSDARASAQTSATLDTLPDSVLIARADRGRTIGDSTAPIWIVMISDFQCPYCKQFHDGTLRDVMRNYVNTGKARFAYLNLPLQQHVHARPAARAALCASAQGKFWAYTDSIFAAQERLGTMTDATSLLTTFAQQLSLDMPAFAHCRKSAAIDRVIQVDEQQAARAGVRSTPSFFVGDFLVEGNAPYTEFRRAVDTALTVSASRRNR